MRYTSADDCPDRDKHTPQPYGYVERSTWAEKKLRTHTQQRCSTCGFYAIWKRRPVRKTRAGRKR